MNYDHDGHDDHDEQDVDDAKQIAIVFHHSDNEWS